MQKLITIALLFLSMGCSEEPAKEYKYEVRVCNAMGCSYYDADSVKQVSNKYMLFVDKKVTTIQSPIVIVIVTQNK